VIPALLAQIGLPLLVKAVGGALEKIDHPVAKAATSAMNAVDAAIVSKSITPEHLAEANRHTERMTELDQAAQKIDIDLLKVHSDDRGSARAMTARLASADSKTAWSAPLLSALLITGFFWMLYVVLTQPLPEGSKEVSMILLGALGASFGQVANFWLGSSKGSSDKTEMLKQVLPVR